MEKAIKKFENGYYERTLSRIFDKVSMKKIYRELKRISAKQRKNENEK